ncbi:MAG: hypothetical protein RBU27_05480 [Bacteroidota bacterium]|jgi:hypothetical protein|nr:hypothetical protein [Bacteroidota bacterium]
MNKLFFLLMTAMLIVACGEKRTPDADLTDADIAGMIDWAAASKDTSVVASVGTCRRCSALAVLFTEHKIGPSWSAFCWECGNEHSYFGSMDNTTIGDIIDPDAPTLHSMDEIRKAISGYMTADNPVAVERYVERHRKHAPVEVFQ